jgi:hypothetical protein
VSFNNIHDRHSVSGLINVCDRNEIYELICSLNYKIVPEMNVVKQKSVLLDKVAFGLLHIS